MSVKAGQFYGAKNQKTGRHRYVEIQQVRGASGASPYAIVREVSRSGNPARGRDPHGLDRSASFNVALQRGPKGVLLMPSAYEEVIQTDAPEET